MEYPPHHNHALRQILGLRVPNSQEFKSPKGTVKPTIKKVVRKKEKGVVL